VGLPPGGDVCWICSLEWHDQRIPDPRNYRVTAPVRLGRMVPCQRRGAVGVLSCNGFIAMISLSWMNMWLMPSGVDSLLCQKDFAPVWHDALAQAL